MLVQQLLAVPTDAGIVWATHVTVQPGAVLLVGGSLGALIAVLVYGLVVSWQDER